MASHIPQKSGFDLEEVFSGLMRQVVRSEYNDLRSWIHEKFELLLANLPRPKDTHEDRTTQHFDTDSVVSLLGAARIASVPEQTICQWVKSGRLRSLKSSPYRFMAEDVLRAGVRR